jgi:hypothetical protein
MELISGSLAMIVLMGVAAGISSLIFRLVQFALRKTLLPVSEAMATPRIQMVRRMNRAQFRSTRR